MDALLGQLRQQMHDLSQQGDGVTLQMWKLYTLLEDFAAHVYKTNMMEWPEIQANQFMDLLPLSNKDMFDIPSKECILEGCTGKCLDCESNPNIAEYSIQKSESQKCRTNNVSLDTTLKGINLPCKENSMTISESISKDYEAYSGSTSADSGYKSCESTASEMSNVSYYDSKLHFDEVEGSNFKNSFSKQSPPKIRMGTKAVIWQTKKPVHSQSFSKASTCKKTDSRFYDTRLDHLMYLRASVMNVLKDKKSDVLSLASDNVEPAESGSEICSGIENNPKLSLQLLFDSQAIRTNTETPLLEKEIDELLYGKAEYYDLESVENFPCSYVTMIEEKYKRGRKCKDYHKNYSKKMPTSSEKGSVIENTKSNKDKTGVHNLEHDNKLSEVARSMLEIIQDLSQQGMPAAQHHPSNISLDNSLHNLGSVPSSVKNSSLPASEYHIYEEIPNDYNSNKLEKSVFPIPPPLPKRHPSMFHTSLGLSNSVENTLNKPKRRDNLYSLFNDQCSRRCLSASLAEEWKEHQKEQFLDEYGFRRDNI